MAERCEAFLHIEMHHLLDNQEFQGFFTDLGVTALLGTSELSDEGGFSCISFQETWFRELFLLLILPHAFSQFQFIFYVFCCLAKRRNTGLLFYSTCFLQVCSGTALLLCLLRPGLAVHPALLCPIISTATRSSSPRTSGFKSEGHRKAISLC